MARRPAVIVAAATAALLAVSASSAATSAKTLPSHPFVTAVYLNDPSVDVAPLAYKRVADAGASVVRILVSWRDIAPAKKPGSWDPADPTDTHYNWSTLDAQVKLAVAHGLQPLLTVLEAPSWAQEGVAVPAPNSHFPSPTKFGQFAHAIAARYDGSFNGLPRVRYWQAWNEPNLSLYLVPQLVKRKPVSPGWYRQMLNAFADAVHFVHADNVVVAAGLAPFRDVTPSVTKQDSDWGPLSFMRSLLCLSKTLHPTCSNPVHFDVWAQHPYTSGGPTHQAVLPNDVSLPEIPEVQQVLVAAERYHHIRSSKPVQFWVTEFSWDTNPPDPEAVPALLARRWTAQALYEMWADGVSLVTWLMLRDDSMNGGYLQSGLYYVGSSLVTDRPKPLLAAFRFPVVGLPQRSGVYVWGRTPGGKQGRVRVQHQIAGKWQTLSTLLTDKYGVFQAWYAIRYSGWVRAQLVTGDVSPPFRLANVPDRFFNPFGLTTPLEPKSKAP